MQYMLDTNTCIHIIGRNPRVTLQGKLVACGISSIVLGELELGVERSSPNSRDKNRLALSDFLSMVKVLSVTDTVAEKYAEIRAHIEKNDKQIGPNDLWIAAHAVALDLPLVTNNQKEFDPVPDLRTETWVEEEREEIPKPEPQPKPKPKQRLVDASGRFTNPTDQGVRGIDAQGSGAFGASRAGHTHLGADYITTPGQEVFAVADGRVARLVSGEHSGIVIGDGKGISYKILYMDVDRSIGVGSPIRSGQVLGIAQDITTRYPGITNHVHVKLRVNYVVVDPEKYIPSPR